MKNPLISCLCVSYNRPQQLALAIECFHGQTYKNKELVIVGHADDEESQRVASEAGPNVVFHAVPKASLGELRNGSIQLSKGDYFCQWDDDDWYHKSRLAEQLKVLRKMKKQACVMAYWLMYDKVNGEAYFSYPTMWAGTIMCHRSIYEAGIHYKSLGKSEDEMYMKELYATNLMVPLVMPSLYIYVYHGRNTWEAEHFKTLFSRGQPLSSKTSTVIGDILSKKYSHSQSSKIMTNLIKEFNYFHAFE